MTQEQTAVAFVNKFSEVQNGAGSTIESLDFFAAKECAIILVVELRDNNAKAPAGYISNYDYWQGIKTAIEKL